MPSLPSSANLPFARLAGFSRLFRDYATGEGAARAFFGRDPFDPAARAEAAAVAAARPRDRAALGDVLEEQHRAWDAPAAVGKNRERLRGPESAAVVTGQQLGLFGGPLYTVYKAVTAIQLARRLERETGRAVVPVFWLADEDHDWDEVRTAVFPFEGGTREVALPADAARPPVGRRVLGDGISRALAEAEALLPATAHTPALLAAVREAYRPGRPHRDAFARLLLEWFGDAGLVVMSADDARFKHLGAGLFAREVRCWGETLEALEAQSRELEGAGYHAQLAPSPVNLFLLDTDGQRRPLDPADGGGFVLRGTDRRFSEADLLALLDAHPERVSPNAALRPLYQDTLLPTAAYVAGPGEAAYYAQLPPVYAAFGVPMPVIYPRASATFVPARVTRAMEHFGLALADLQGDVEALHRRLALEAADVEVEAAFARARDEAAALALRLTETAAAVDPTLERAGGALGAALAREVERLRAKTVRAVKRREAETGRRLADAQAWLAPGGGLQERTLAPLALLNAAGPAWLERLLGELPLDTAAHHVLPL